MKSNLSSRLRRGPLLALGVGALVAVVAFPACSILLEADATQCATTTDCVRRGPAFASAVCASGICRAEGGAADAGDPWSCLASPPAAAPPPDADVAVTMSLFDPVTPAPGRNGKALPGIVIRGCAKLDVVCANPIVASVTTDAEGNAKLGIPAGFDGYLELTGPSIVPALWYFSPLPDAQAAPRSYNVGLLSPASFSQIAATVGASIDDTAGHSFNFALDCAQSYGTFGSGVSFTPSATRTGTRSFYLINGLPSTTATTTDGSGVGGFVNLKPGVVTVTADLAGQRTGSVSVLIRAGVITYSPIAPSL
jgi:hypothetical protein